MIRQPAARDSTDATRFPDGNITTVLRVSSVAAAAGAVLLLSSCVKTDVDLTVRPDDVVDGTIVMAVDQSFAAGNDHNQTALLDSLREHVLPSLRSGARQEPYSDGQYVGTRVVLDHMTLADLDRSTGEGGLKIVHQGGRFRLTGRVDTTELTSAASSSNPQDAQRLRDTFDVIIRVTFPGQVVSSNGSVTGRTVTWRPRLGDRLDLAAQAEDADFPWVWLVVAGLVLAAATAAALVRSRRRRDRADPGDPADPSEPDDSSTNRRVGLRVNVEIHSTRN
ncbi:MAG TPA: hypothetical protein VOB72_26100 [Candidatus Dormibacteraeota bacterium]|nr:hypothetical protein [Candidatus Dormibacteraeota bacterium]